MKEWKSLIQILRDQITKDTVLLSFQVVNLRDLEETRPTINALFDYNTGDCFSLILQTDYDDVELECYHVEALEHFFKEYGTKLHSSDTKVKREVIDKNG